MRLALVLVVTVGCTKEAAQGDEREPTTAITATETPAAAESPPEQPREPTLAERIAAADSLAEALEVALPEMEDVRDQSSLGALALALWSSTRLRFEEVAVRRNETNPKLILKDSDRERGKRMCARGSIIQIAKQTTGESPLFAGLLMTSRGQVIHFIAAGDTGDLVDGSRARFCGVATGRYSYANAGGGTTHAIQLVGMFDLPTNHAASRLDR